MNTTGVPRSASTAVKQGASPQLYQGLRELRVRHWVMDRDCPLHCADFGLAHSGGVQGDQRRRRERAAHLRRRGAGSRPGESDSRTVRACRFRWPRAMATDGEPAGPAGPARRGTRARKCGHEVRLGAEAHVHELSICQGIIDVAVGGALTNGEASVGYCVRLNRFRALARSLVAGRARSANVCRRLRGASWRKRSPGIVANSTASLPARET